jgi:hypothetical protein
MNVRDEMRSVLQARVMCLNDPSVAAKRKHTVRVSVDSRPVERPTVQSRAYEASRDFRTLAAALSGSANVAIQLARSPCAVRSCLLFRERARGFQGVRALHESRENDRDACSCRGSRAVDVPDKGGAHVQVAVADHGLVSDHGFMRFVVKKQH